MTENAEQLYKRALSEMKKEQWLSAIKIFKLRPDAVEEDWKFSWNLGWCYFKLDKFDTARKHMVRATRLAPENPVCKCGLGMAYLMRKQFKKAEVVLAESLRIKESDLTRGGLALAYLSQGKVVEAESVHLEGIKRKPKSGQRYVCYAAFLSDVGRKTESRRMEEKASKLQRVN
jgi:Tfp pilus assembly protein PilF